MSMQQASHLYVLFDHTVHLPAGDVELTGRLTVPTDATRIVIFAHGSGSSRNSPRNWFVAEALHEQRLATLVIDLLSEEEGRLDQRTGHLRFNIPLLARRLVAIADWVAKAPETSSLGICFFGASTGAAAALIAAAETTHPVHSVVSRGGRPDMAEDYLPQVKAPTLLIVGGNDHQVLELNEKALERLNARSKLVIIRGAGHLFQEPGALEKVAHMAGSWFKHHEAGHAFP